MGKQALGSGIRAAGCGFQAGRGFPAIECVRIPVEAEIVGLDRGLGVPGCAEFGQPACAPDVRRECFHPAPDLERLLDLTRRRGGVPQYGQDSQIVGRQIAGTAQGLERRTMTPQSMEFPAPTEMRIDRSWIQLRRLFEFAERTTGRPHLHEGDREVRVQCGAIRIETQPFGEASDRGSMVAGGGQSQTLEIRPARILSDLFPEPVDGFEHGNRIPGDENRVQTAEFFLQPPRSFQALLKRAGLGKSDLRHGKRQQKHEFDPNSPPEVHSRFPPFLKNHRVPVRGNCSSSAPRGPASDIRRDPDRPRDFIFGIEHQIGPTGMMHAHATIRKMSIPSSGLGRSLFRVLLGWTTIVALSIASTATARAENGVLFDFEGPFLLDGGRTIKDHSLVFDPSTQTWHVYYIRGVTGVGGTSSETELGHAVSSNLRSWYIVASALTASTTGFDERNTWAPDVVRNLTDDGWEMFYTGRDDFFLQRAGKATSTDLFDWVKVPENPILEPDSTVYLWSPDLDVPQLSSFRDPFLIEVDGQWNLLHTALVPDETVSAGYRAVVHRSVSADRENWTEVAPLAFSNGANGPWRDIESIQVVEHDGIWTMFFTYFGIQGVQWIQSNTFDSGWDFQQAETLDTGIAAELTPVGPGTWIFTRHIPQQHGIFHPLGGQVFFTLRADTLRFDPVTKVPQITKTDPLAEDWIQRTGTAFIAAPTFGDNQLERGEPSVGAVGHGYLSSREFFDGPLGNAGALGASLGNSAFGSITSRWFSIGAADSLIDFRIAGTDTSAVRIELLRRDAQDSLLTEVVRVTSPKGNNSLTRAYWDVRDLRGDEVQVKIIDEDSQGYIAVDHFRVWVEPTNPTAAPPMQAMSRITRVAPNPFNPRTVVEFSLPRNARVTVLLHDLRGRRVRTIDRGTLDAGTHEQVWNGRDDAGREVASGVYLVRVVTDGAVGAGRKITLVR